MEIGGKYRVRYDPSQKTGKPLELIGTYLGPARAPMAEHAFDLRPKAGTAYLNESQIVLVESVDMIIPHQLPRRVDPR